MKIVNIPVPAFDPDDEWFDWRPVVAIEPSQYLPSALARQPAVQGGPQAGTRSLRFTMSTSRPRKTQLHKTLTRISCDADVIAVLGLDRAMSTSTELSEEQQYHLHLGELLDGLLKLETAVRHYWYLHETGARAKGWEALTRSSPLETPWRTDASCEERRVNPQNS